MIVVVMNVVAMTEIVPSSAWICHPKNEKTIYVPLELAARAMLEVGILLGKMEITAMGICMEVFHAMSTFASERTQMLHGDMPKGLIKVPLHAQ